MKAKLANRFAARIGTTVAMATVVLFAVPVWAQDSRLSLADRVARLEQQAQHQDQGGIGMVNQMQQLQSQVQQLQGQIEVLQHQLQELQDKSKAQYLDLDSRIGHAEGVGGAGSAAVSASAAGLPQATNSTPAPASGASALDGNAATGAADGAGAQASYDAAFKALRDGDYAQASRGFRSFTQQYPDNSLAPNAWYWLGESYYVTLNYPVALESFQHLLSQFPKSEKAADALLKVGYCQLELKQTAAARASLQSVARKYPGSKAASLAQERLRRLQPGG